MNPLLRAEFERLALELECEISLCTTRVSHVRATAHAVSLRRLLAAVDAQPDSPTPAAPAA